MKKESNNSCANVSVQTHVHEFEGSVMIGNPPDSPQLAHNHRFSGTTGPEIPEGNSHVHVFKVDSDFFFNHYHQVEGMTGPAILIRDQSGRPIGHVHGVSGTSSCVFFHDHGFRFATLIQNPIGPILLQSTSE